MTNTNTKQIEAVIKDGSQEFDMWALDSIEDDDQIKQQIKDYFENTNYKPLHIIKSESETAETVNMKSFLDTLDPQTAANLLTKFAWTQDKNVWSAEWKQRHYRDDNIALIQLYLWALWHIVAVDGILWPETQKALEAYWGKENSPDEGETEVAEESEKTPSKSYNFTLPGKDDKGAEVKRNDNNFDNLTTTVTITWDDIMIQNKKINIKCQYNNTTKNHNLVVDDITYIVELSENQTKLIITKSWETTSKQVTLIEDHQHTDETPIPPAAWETTEEVKAKETETKEVTVDDGKKITITTIWNQTTYTYDGIDWTKASDSDIYTFQNTTHKIQTNYTITKNNSDYEVSFVSQTKWPFGSGDTEYSIKKNAEKKLYFIKWDNNFEITINNNLQQWTFSITEKSDDPKITTDYIIDKFDYDMIDWEKWPMIWKSIHTTEHNNQSLEIGDNTFIKYQVFDEYTWLHKKVTLSNTNNNNTQDLIFTKNWETYDPVYQYDSSILDTDDHILSSGFGDALSNDTTTKRSTLIESTNTNITLNPSTSDKNYQCVLDNNNSLTITPTTVYNMSWSWCTGLLHVLWTSPDQTLIFQWYYEYSNNNMLQDTPVVLKKNANTEVMVWTKKYTIKCNPSGLITEITLPNT
jgi:hypothetical protein